MARMRYESLVRDAFSFSSSKPVDRYGDPAALADTDVFDGAIERAKVGAAYSIEILRVAVVNSGKVGDDAEHDRLDAFLSRIQSALTKADLDQVITDFRDSVIDEYFERDQATKVLRLKP